MPVCLYDSAVGEVIGGTRGNLVLEYVSGAPNKQRIQEEVADIFDYDELIKYGYSHLVTPIMSNGGRRSMYQFMDLPEPATPERLTKKKSAPKLVIDRTGVRYVVYILFTLCMILICDNLLI